MVPTIFEKVRRNLSLLTRESYSQVIAATGLDKLWILQDTLVEHKFPTNGITEYVISAAGDIYREMADEYPWFPYIDEKWRTLSKYCFRGRYGFVVGDFEELREMVEKPDYEARKDLYMVNLRTLREATLNTPMEAKRMRVMLASLDMIKALADWFDSLVLEMPGQVSVAYNELTDAIAKYFPEQFWLETPFPNEHLKYRCKLCGDIVELRPEHLMQKHPEIKFPQMLITLLEYFEPIIPQKGCVKWAEP